MKKFISILGSTGSVGLNTLKQCKLAGLKGIVLKHKSNIFLDKARAIKFANKNKLFILVK